MKVIGIIAEYNPFHNGHAYQIEKIKKDLQADYVVVAMSGNFVQRGAPAIIDKYARTQMALSCGVDLVIELPVLWATASAEYFAMAGVTLFDKMGCIDGICFGAETDDLGTLSMLADVLINEPDAYRLALSKYLKEGAAFPVARSNALCEYFSQMPFHNAASELSLSSYDLDCITCILNEPNNILAIEYLKALKRRHSSITPYVIKREGAGYHDEYIAETSGSIAYNTIPIPTASATAIRKVLHSGISFADLPNPETLVSALPAPALEVLKTYCKTHALVYPNDFSSMLGYLLLTSDTGKLSDIGDATPELANRFFKNRLSFSSFDQFCEWNKSKDTTYTRLSRIFMHFILNISNDDYSFGKELDYIPYLRILGFRKDSSILLKILKHSAKIPLISKLADASALLDTSALTILEKDIFAADLYSQVRTAKNDVFPQSEYTRNIVIV
ncbi:MAG: nucleotidyltransferase family protein [Roseburia sp.]|nr:nucleotidyltransferase family protein [Roseburia sp.]